MSAYNMRKIRTCGDEFPTLECPDCKNNYLHQVKTTVFERQEDAPVTRCVSVDRTSYEEMDQRIEKVCEVSDETIPSENSGNPSGRRQGIKIAFLCENCGMHNEPKVMVISQHKGVTEFYWDNQ